MKQGWEVRKLGEVLKLEYGKPLPNDKRIPDGKYPIYGANGEKGKTNEFYYDKKTILVGRKGSAGEINLTDEKFWPLDVTYFVTFEGKKYDLMFLFHLLSLLELPKMAKGVKPGINRNEVYDVKVNFPPLLEQQRIVAILDEAFAAIAKAKANTEQNLKNAKELFESYLQSVFENKGEGWEENTLGEVCEISSKLIDPKKPEFQELIHVGAGNIESQKGTLLNLKTAKEEGLISGKFLFDESMVLYSKIRPYLMKVLNCNFQGLCSADIYPLLPFKEKITKDFLYHLLLSKDFTEYAILGSQRAGMPKVNREHLFAYGITLPPLKDQQTIVQKLDALSVETKQLEAIYQQKINDLDELKKSILQKAFAGELC